MKQLVLDMAPPSRPSLENFVPGRNGVMLQALCGLPEAEFGKRSLYIWGASGCGKTHLITSLADHFEQQGTRTCLLDGQNWEGLDDADVTLLDDVHLLHPEAQVQLFNLFNALRESGRALIVSGPCAPMELAVRDDLRTRLGWGQVYQVLSLDDAEKAAALQRHASERGFRLPPEVVDYLLRHVRRDLHSLMGMLEAIDRWSLAEKKPVTVPLLRQLLQQSLDI